MKPISLISSFLLFAIHIYAKADSIEKYCDTSNNYYAMEITKADEMLIQNENDSIQVFLENIRPPIKWWRTSISNKEDNRNYTITNNVKYLNQLLVRIVNRTNHDLTVINPDGRLPVGLQAKNNNNVWVNVEFLDNWYCLLSFNPKFDMILKPNYEIKSFAQLFPGDIKTKYRLVFVYNPRADRNKRKYFYSNEVEGTIAKCKLVDK